MPGIPALIRAAGKALRYRFFLVAGVFPYFLGAAVAYHAQATLDWRMLFAGAAGVIAVSVGIEGMNEYFDAKLGGDRVFASTARKSARWHLPVGLSGFGIAFLIGSYLAHLRGWPVLGFTVFGAVAALSYLIPPVHLSYRGFGETIIAVGYGPGLTLGAFYLQANRLSWECAYASLLPALLMFALALVNEVPDYYGDRLVGKRNLIVRLGGRRGTRLSGMVLTLFFAAVIVGVGAGIFPCLLLLVFLLVPLSLRSGLLASRSWETPTSFGPVIDGTILLYVLANLAAIAAYAL